MTKTTALRALFAGAGVAAAGAMGMAVASADDGTQQADLGGAAQLVDGDTVQQWTVGGLRPSGDTIDYTPGGSLWEATATNTSVAGGNIPFVPGFSARGGDDTYPVLWGVASPQGVNPAGLAAGQSSTGKLYFDVTGANPNQIVFADDGRDIAVWVTPPPPPASGGSAPAAVYSPPASVGVMPAPPAVAPAAPAATAPAPAAPKAPAPGAAGTPVTPPAATGSQGTPLPATGSQGTPLPAGSTPAATTPAPASTAAPASPAPTSPSPASPSPANAAPASPSAAATPAPSGGSQGTPLTAPTTTVVPTPGT